MYTRLLALHQAITAVPLGSCRCQLVAAAAAAQRRCCRNDAPGTRASRPTSYDPTTIKDAALNNSDTSRIRPLMDSHVETMAKAAAAAAAAADGDSCAAVNRSVAMATYLLRARTLGNGVRTQETFIIDGGYERTLFVQLNTLSYLERSVLPLRTMPGAYCRNAGKWLVRLLAAGQG